MARGAGERSVADSVEVKGNAAFRDGRQRASSVYDTEEKQCSAYPNHEFPALTKRDAPSSTPGLKAPAEVVRELVVDDTKEFVFHLSAAMRKSNGSAW